MATEEQSHFILYPGVSGGSNMKFYLNEVGEIFVQDIDAEREFVGTWFTINQEDWKELKKFIDSKFE